jgi:hypothetical protein
MLGRGDQRIVGTWQLYERYIPTDSVPYSLKISNKSPQTITFTADGRISSVGKETEYYRSSHHYLVDSTDKGLRIGFIISKQYSAFYQGLTIKKDTLIFIPDCQPSKCNSTFIKAP